MKTKMLISERRRKEYWRNSRTGDDMFKRYFYDFVAWLLDYHIPVLLRLRFFDAVVSPTAVFAGSVLSFKKSDFSKIDIAQRKMLRNIIGL